MGSEAWSERDFWTTLGRLHGTQGLHGTVSISFKLCDLQKSGLNVTILRSVIYGQVSGNKRQASPSKASPLGM